MKIVKEGIITEDGKLVGWTIDCEGEAIDLSEILAYIKVKKAQRRVS